MKTNIHLLSNLTHFSLEWEMFYKKFVEKIKTYFEFSNIFRKSCRLGDTVEKHFRVRQAADDNT
jgi:hypothetical protein